MITAETILSIEKAALPEAAKNLTSGDILQLVEWLNLKDDALRYQAFLLLQQRSMLADDVYPYWDTFCGKLTSGNSYQRSIGLMLLAENAKWDDENRLEQCMEDYLALLGDEKPITVRQCIQSLAKIVPHKPDLGGRIAERLISFDLMSVKETMRKSILLDILNILLLIRKELTHEGVEAFLFNALSGEVLDKKSKKQLEAAL